MPASESKNSHSRGGMILATLFVVFLSMAGMALLTHTLIHQHVLSARIKKISETERIFQELIWYQHHFREKVFNDHIVQIPSPESDYFNTDTFPSTQVNKALIENSFSSHTLDYSQYRRIRIMDHIQIHSLKGNRHLKSDIIIDLLTGNIPIYLIPFFLNADIEVPEEFYLNENHIDIQSRGQFLIDDFPVNFDVTGFLADALNIQGSLLGWKEIRQKFGFEISDDPIEKGIYILEEGGRIESVFIQGDLEKLIFSCDEEFQKVAFVQDGQSHSIRYKPGEDFFQCWIPAIPVQAVFNQNIVVNGNLWSLEQGQKQAFTENTEIKLLVSGQTVISTSLENQSLEIEKIRLNNLTLIAGAHDLTNPDGKQPAVTVDTGEKTTIRANILVQGRFENRNDETEIVGSLFAREITNRGRLSIRPAGYGFDSNPYFFTGIMTFISDFFVDFIEEVYDV